MGKSQQNLVACHHCGLLQEMPDLPVGSHASCVRCECFLQRNLPDTVHRTLAFAITGIILFIITI